MNIKKLVAGSMLSMLMASEMAAADWGDVYYCQMTNFDKIKLEGEKENYTLEKFQFKLDQTKNAMVFGSTGFFQGAVYKLTKNKNHPEQELWYANDSYSIFFFDTGKFMFTRNAINATVISAACDKF